jgi:hypothetical protein
MIEVDRTTGSDDASRAVAEHGVHGRVARLLSGTAHRIRRNDASNTSPECAMPPLRDRDGSAIALVLAARWMQDAHGKPPEDAGSTIARDTAALVGNPGGPTEDQG